MTNSNTGNRNTGDCNTGDRNTGDSNTGNRNTGNFNAGDDNTGNYNAGTRNAGTRNAGNYNTGDCNAGNFNTGNYNTGDCNTGNFNTGDCNTGNYNTGDRNTGYYNAGDCNTGNRNTGYYNAGDCNTGFFCTDTPKPVFFDKPAPGISRLEAINLIPRVTFDVAVEFISTAKMTEDEKDKYPSHKTTGGYLKTHALPLAQAFPKAWEKMDDETRQRFLDLPNFDADKFLEITGVDVRKQNTHEIVVNGEVINISGDDLLKLKSYLQTIETTEE